MAKVMRNMLQEFYGIPGESATTYHYLNTGFTQLDENGGAQLDDTAYIGDKCSSPSVVGYENNWSFNTQYLSNNDVIKDIRDIARLQKTGSDCERELISVDLNDPVSGSEGAYKARKFNISVEAAPPKGEPKSVTTMEGTFHQMGDLVEGTFVISSKTFTETA